MKAVTVRNTLFYLIAPLCMILCFMLTIYEAGEAINLSSHRVTYSDLYPFLPKQQAYYFALTSAIVFSLLLAALSYTFFTRKYTAAFFISSFIILCQPLNMLIYEWLTGFRWM